MSRKRVITIFMVFIVASFLLIGFLVGPLLFADSAQVSKSSSPQTQQPANSISAENAQTGTFDWLIPPAQESTYQIEAYAGATSVAPGNSITFYVSTQNQGNY